MIISVPVQMAVKLARPEGAPAIDIDDQVLLLGLYFHPVVV
jgi:hypothetical protein